jgi:ligand-binding sensor domain-containing protein
MKMMAVKMNKIWIRVFVGFIFTLIATNSFSQVRFKGIPYIKNYTRHEYNASPFNWAVVQDARGLMYIANNYFLMELDGKSWRYIVLQNRTVVRSLAIDEKGKVYVGGQDDFGYLAPDDKGEMQYISLKSKIEKQYQNFDDVWKIYVTSEGVAFCTAAGIYQLMDDKITFHAIKDTLLDLCFYVNDRLFLTVLNKGIYEFKKNEIVLIPNSEKISNDFISGMLQGVDSDILIVTNDNGIYSYDGYSGFKPWNTQADKFLKQNKIVSAAKLSNGYAFGSSYDGLIVIDKKGVPVLHLNKTKGLQDNGVEYIYPDNAGNLWLALRNGIDYLEINSPFSLYNSQTKISGAAFTSLLEKTRLYLGTSEGLYYKDWTNGQNALNESEFKLIENSEGQTYNLQKIKDLLLLSHHNGAYQIIGNKAFKVSDHHGVWLFQPLAGKPDYILCGTYTGLILFQIVNGKLEFRNKIKDFEESSRIMEQDSEGNIWIAHGYKGVYKIRLNNDLTSVEKMDFYNSKNGFPSDVFINVFKINNKLVFAGEHGIYKYNKTKNSFEEHEEFNKLIDKNNHTRKLIEDKEGNIWFSSADETGVLKKMNNGNYDVSKTIFNKLSRSLVGGFEHITYYDEHNVLIGTNEGFVQYDPSFVDHADRTFSTILRKVEDTSIKDSLISGGSFNENTNVGKIQPEEKVPVIPFALNSLRFTYSALSFEDVDRIEYQYILEGHDKNWSTWTPMMQKEYTNLHEGDYVFKVKAKNIYNRESLEASYKFTVLPPWYRTYWSYAIYFAMLGVVLYMVRKLTKIEQQKAMRLKEAEHKEQVLKAEKEIIKLNNEKLEDELNHKSKELTSSAMHIVHAVENNQKIRTQVLDAMGSVQDKDALYHFRKILKAIESEISLENNWEQFELHFNQIHQDFLVRLRKEFPLLTHGDIKLCAYLRLNLSSKEIAPLLNLSIRGIEASRYRIRKKMNLSAEVNLTEFILRY